MLLCVLEHVSTRLLTLAAFLGTHLHVFVVRELLTLRRALGTRIDTGRADDARERTASRHDLRSARTHCRAVLAGRERDGMLLLAFTEHVGAVSRTHIARTLAVRACFGTRLHHFVVFHVIGFLLLRLALLGESAQAEDY